MKYNPTQRLGLLFRLGSFWVGIHYSYKEKRICVNVLPCITFWFTLKGGVAPSYEGFL